MLSSPTLRTWLILPLLLALLTVRLGGAHLHLCFDGSEPPASLHFEDAEHHEDHHAVDAHEDADVSLTADAVSQLGKLGMDLPLLLGCALLLLGLLTRSAQIRPCPALQRFIPLPYFLRPPLRGPPIFNSP